MLLSLDGENGHDLSGDSPGNGSAELARLSDGESIRSIEDVIELMSFELDRLKEVLQTLRLARASQEQIAWHIEQIDAREDELERLRRIIQH